MQIFVSYASKNREIVTKLVEDLNDLEHAVWFDQKLTGGQEWWEEILSGVRSCDLFIFALTQQSLDSMPCRREYQYASQLNKRILPVLLDEVNMAVLPPELAVIQVVDYRQADKKAAFALNRALNLLPPLKSLPDPLPTPPPAPISPLAELRSQIDAPSLDADQQRLLLAKLVDLTNNPETKNDARTLMRRFRQRSDLLATIDRDLSIYLQNRKPNEVSLRLLVLADSKEEFAGVKIVPNEKQVATISKDGTIRFWDLNSGEELFELLGHSWGARISGFSSNSQYMLTTGRGDYNIVLWDISLKRPIVTLPNPFGISDDRILGQECRAAITPDGDQIIAVGMTYKNDEVAGITLKVWDIKSQKEIYSLEPFEGEWKLQHFSISSDGSKVLVLADGLLQIYDTRTWDRIQQIENANIGIREEITYADFSPDGKLVITAIEKQLVGNLDYYGVIWDIDSGEVKNYINKSTDDKICYANCVRYLPNGKDVILTTNLGEIKLSLFISAFDSFHSGKTIGFGGHTNLVHGDIDISVSGNFVATRYGQRGVVILPIHMEDFNTSGTVKTVLLDKS